MATSVSLFTPDWVSPPGDTIADILAERHLSVPEFAVRIGQTVEDANDLLEGRSTITIRTARALEEVLGASVQFWMARDFRYRDDIKRLRSADEPWLSDLPLGDMIKFGWLTPTPTPSEEMAACLRFFDVPNVGAWQQRYAALHQVVPFRTSMSFESRPAAVAAWLRQAEIEAQKIVCGAWDVRRFELSLSEIRPLTRVKDPGQFLPKVRQLCAGSGVAVATVRSPNGCRASGAVFFASPEKAVLLLSFRYLSDDQFWFTFFHEAGHLILHASRGLFLEGVEEEGMLTSTEEQEANDFAARVLVPDVYRQPLVTIAIDAHQIIRFARKIGISPGIVVGQLQHLGRIKPRQMNSLKRRYEWQDQ